MGFLRYQWISNEYFFVIFHSKISLYVEKDLFFWTEAIADKLLFSKYDI